jgi:hypothetical protein
MKMENLDQFMKKNLKKFERDMGEQGSSLMLRVVEKLPADYELNTSTPDSVTSHAGEAIDNASISVDEMKILARLKPTVYKNNAKANQLSLMHLLIVSVAKRRLEPEVELVSSGSHPPQANVDAVVSELLLNLKNMDLEKLLDADLEQGEDDVLLVSPRSSSPDPRNILPGSSSASSNAAAMPQSSLSAATPRDSVANFRKGTSVPPSPRSVSREPSGENKAGNLATLTGKSGSPKPLEKERNSAPVSRESSGSDLEDSSGATNETDASSVQRLRSVSQRSVVTPQSPPRTLTNTRALTGGAARSAPASPDKGKVDGQLEEKQ